MVIMALDHARDFSHPVPYAPTDLSQTSALLFVTRWVTHFCAPVFVFLAGTAIYLFHARHGDAGRTSRFLLSRGFWLVLLEFLVVNPSWNAGFYWTYLFGQVIWVMGISMMLMAVLIRLPFRVVVGFGFLLVLGHNLLDGVAVDEGVGGMIWTVLHVQGQLDLGPVAFDIVYPLVPWVGVMALGYGLGRVMQRPAPDRVRWLARAGTLTVLGFVVLRATNVYGDPSLWENLGGWRGVASFVNCSKYPPSLLFLAMTLGPSLWFLALMDGRTGWVERRLRVFGQVPLFFYLLHVPLLHLIAVLANAVRFDTWSWYEIPLAERDMGLPATYLIWIAVVVLLYPGCAVWRRLKRTRSEWWLRYL